jgi:hypothetical protein
MHRNNRPVRRWQPPVSLVGLLMVLATGVAAADTVTCESVGGQEKYCRTNTNGGVYLETQLSHSPCRQDSTWGSDDRGIWVSNGCRAVFHTGRESHDRHDDHNNSAAAAVAGIALLALGAAAAHEAHKGYNEDRHDDYPDYRDDDSNYSDHRNRHQRNQQVLCESSGSDYNYCSVNTRRASVNVLRRHSRAECRFSRDWGYNNGGIWVDNGCRATFELVY